MNKRTTKPRWKVSNLHQAMPAVLVLAKAGEPFTLDVWTAGRDSAKRWALRVAAALNKAKV